MRYSFRPIAADRIVRAGLLAAALALLPPSVWGQSTTVTATLDDNTAASARKLQGDTINYTAIITNTGSTNAATNVTLTNPAPANTTDTGIVSVTPVALNDVYPDTVIANTSIDTATSTGFSVLTNDYLGAPTATITASSTATAGGGTVSVRANGTFVYTPAAGFTGADTFTYSITNPVSPSANANNTATVTVNVSGPVIWYVDSTVASTGSGRLGSPFKTLAEATTAVGANTNQRIFLYSAGSYSGNVTLRAQGWLVGQAAVGTNFDSLMGIAPSADTTVARPSINNGTRPTLTNNTAAGTVVLANNTVVVGVSVRSTAAGAAMSGSAITVAQIGHVSSTDTDIQSSGTATAALILTGAANGNISCNAPITCGAGTAVTISGRSGSSVVFTNSITSTLGGISLISNTGATIAFSGGISVSSGANAAFSATGGGTITATQNNTSIVNTLTTTTGVALSVANTTIGAAGLTFRSVTAGTSVGSAGVGINLDTTGTSGGLTITGNGTAGSGGTIQHKTGADLARSTGIGIYLNNTVNVSLARMQLNDFDNFALRGFLVTGFTMSNCVVSGRSGTSAANLGGTDEGGEGAVIFGNAGVSNVDGLSGTCSITNCTIGGGASRNLQVSDTSSAAGELHLTVDQVIFDQTANLVTAIGNQSFLLEARNSGTVSHVTVTRCTFAGQPADNINCTGQVGTTIHAIIGGAAGMGNIMNNTHPQNNIGGCSLTLATNGIMYFDARNNTMSGADGSAVTIFKASSGTIMEGTFDSNTIGTSGVAGSGSKSGNGVFFSAGGGGTMTVALTNNLIQRYNGNFGISADNTGGSYAVNLTITGNTVRQPGPGAAGALGLTNGSPTSGDTTNVNARILNNDFSDGVVSGIDVYLGASGSSAGTHTFTLSGASAANVASEAAIEAFVKSANNLNGASTNTSVDAYVDAPVTFSAFRASAALPPQPTAPMPLQYAAGGVEASRPPAALPPASAGASQPPAPSASPAQPAPSATPTLTPESLAEVVAAARQRWESTGLSARQRTALAALTFELVPSLASQRLAEAHGTTVRICRTAPGEGWFIDPTPLSDVDFAFAAQPTRLLCAPSAAPAGRVDLLTTILHEMGHALGLPDTYELSDRGDVMFGYLSKGERRLPRAGQAFGRLSGALHAETRPLASPVVIPSLPPGKSVSVFYSVQINASVPPATPSISSQATVSGSNFTTVTSDDPEIAGVQATVTLLGIPPVITSGNATTFTVGTLGSFAVTATGQPAPTFTTASALPSGVTLAANGTLSGTPAAATGGTYSLSIVAANGISPNATQAFTLTVNQAPAITSANNRTFTAGVADSFTVTTTGFPQRTISITAGTLPSGVTLTDNGNGTATIAGTTTAAGASVVTLTASNGVNPAATQSFTLNVSPAAASRFTVAAPSSATAGAAFGVVVTALDPFDNVAAGYRGTVRFTSTDPGGSVTLPANYTFTAGDNGVHTFNNGVTLTTVGARTVTATDTVASTLTGTSGAIAVSPAAATRFSVSAPGTSVSGASFGFTVTALDAFNNTATGYGGTVRFTSTDGAATLPANSTLASGSGMFNATLRTVGSQTVTATDTVSTTTTGTSGAINVTGSAPAFTSANATAFTIGQAGTFTVTTTGIPTAALGSSGALPTGVTFVDNGNGTATLAGTPAAGSNPSYTLNFTASNGVPPNATQTFTLTVNPGTTAPSITSASSTLFNVGSPGTFSVTTTGMPTPALSAGGALPTGVTFIDNGNGTATLAGTPAAGSNGSYPLSITASNGTLPNATQSFTLLVNRPPVPTADTLGAKKNTAATAAKAKLLRNDIDPDGDVLTMLSVSPTSAQGGTVTMDATNVTYSPPSGYVGADSFTYTVSDGRGGQASGTVNVTVSDANVASLNIISITLDANGALIVCQGIPGQNYLIQSTDTLAAPFTTLSGVLQANPATGRFQYQDPRLPGEAPPNRFYRAVVAP